MKNLKPVSVFWFRRDLRLHDNNGLYQALKNSNEVLPVFIFDKIILNRLSNKKDKRVSFIHQTLKALNNELLKSGSSLLAIYDEPLNAFKTICESFTVKNVFTTDFNQFNDEDKMLVDKDLKDLKIIWFPGKIIFADGTTLE